jgi:hypothetical protein
MPIYVSRKSWSMLNNLYLTMNQHWQPFYSWKMAPPHVCVGRWKTSMNGIIKHKHYILNKVEKVRLTNRWFLLFSFLLGFTISIARWVVYNRDLSHFFTRSFTWFGDFGLLFMHSVISCRLQVVAHMNLQAKVLQVVQGKEP